MQNHLCIQCEHYEPSDTPNGRCKALDVPVWSRRPECASKLPGFDYFNPLDTLGNELRAAREAAGLSREEVCAELEIAMRSLQNWELGERVPPKHVVKMLMDYYLHKG